MICEGTPVARLGLRERKKLLTRRAILETAHRMFAERGYDNVTVNEIADAANVSAKTVFVYFSSKEELVFDGDPEFRELFLDRVRDRPPGETPLTAIASGMRELMSEKTEDIPERSSPAAELEQLVRMVENSPTLQARMRLMWDEFEQSLAEVLAKDCGEQPHSPGPRVAAAQLMLLLRLMASEHMVGYLRAHEEPRQPQAIAEWLETAVGLVGDGLSEYGRR